MNSSPPSDASNRAKTAARTAWVLLAACGLIGLTWFLLSNRGAGDVRDLPSPPVGAAAAVVSEAPVAGIMRDHLAALGLQMADHDLAARLFNDPRRGRELVVFVDARDGAHYESGHIPGAYRLESSELARDLPILLPVCLTAETVVVYCNGGDCNDSETAALTLCDIGVGGEKLFVYPGGIAEWQRHGLPVEAGPRQSGGPGNTF